ncbi:hypothetical protein ACFUGD_28450 [Streptomyces sp. NPDC057217]
MAVPVPPQGRRRWSRSADVGAALAGTLAGTKQTPTEAATAGTNAS